MEEQRRSAQDDDNQLSQGRMRKSASSDVKSRVPTHGMITRSAFKREPCQLQQKKRKRPEQEKPKPKFRRFTKEEFAAYNKKCEESDGFDVGHVPEEIMMDLILPLELAECSHGGTKGAIRMAKLALDVYNKKHRKKFRFVKVIRLNGRYVGGVLYYITFQAEAPPQNFQALVYAHKDKTTVKFCRLEGDFKPEVPMETPSEEEESWMATYVPRL